MHGIDRKLFGVIVATAAVTVILMTVVGIVSPRTVAKITAGQVEIVRGDPEAGMKVFGENGCAGCHSIRGIGGDDGPDLSTMDMSKMDSMGMAEDMWNHQPQMVPVLKKLNREISFPKLTGNDMQDVIAFLHSPKTQEKFTADMIAPQFRDL